jgi:hypothetical protein
VSISQLTLLLVHVWSFGRASSGRSRLQVVTSISSGKSSCSKVKGVPQSGQKLRVASAIDLLEHFERLERFEPSTDP